MDICIPTHMCRITWNNNRGGSCCWSIVRRIMCLIKRLRVRSNKGIRRICLMVDQILLVGIKINHRRFQMSSNMSSSRAWRSLISQLWKIKTVRSYASFHSNTNSTCNSTKNNTKLPTAYSQSHPLKLMHLLPSPASNKTTLFNPPSCPLSHKMAHLKTKPNNKL